MDTDYTDLAAVACPHLRADHQVLQLVDHRCRRLAAVRIRSGYRPGSAGSPTAVNPPILAGNLTGCARRLNDGSGGRRAATPDGPPEDVGTRRPPDRCSRCPWRAAAGEPAGAVKVQPFRPRLGEAVGVRCDLPRCDRAWGGRSPDDRG